MKVLLLNGSRNEQGCTYTALRQVAGELMKTDIETEIICVGKAYTKELADMILEKMRQADGLVVGSPVYFASPNGAIISLLDHIFMKADVFYLKPAAAVTSARRAGTTATIDVFNKYFNLAGMPIVSSNYYNVIHGHTAEEVQRDEEGIQTMRILGKNMAWLLKSIEVGKQSGLVAPEKEKKIKTSYIQ